MTREEFIGIPTMEHKKRNMLQKHDLWKHKLHKSLLQHITKTMLQRQEKQTM
jgi:hypothetical protein